MRQEDWAMLSVRHPEGVDFTYRHDKPIQPVFHSHPWYEVYYFHEGHCNYLIGDRIYTLSPGDLILMHGMTLHSAKINPSVPYIRSIIHFEPAAFEPLQELPHAVPFLLPFRKLTNFRLSLQGRDREEAERLLAEMAAHKDRGDAVGQSRMQIVFVNLLHFIYDMCLKPMSTQPEYPSEKERTVQRIITYIDERFDEELNMDRLQADLHISKFYLSRMFKDVTGVTIFDFVFQRRINQAKILFLMDPSRSVTEVSLQTGFKHLAHFSRLFKSQVGVTPEKYRKWMREQQTKKS